MDRLTSLALSKFSGCDNSEVEAGSASNPTIWLLGLEHGTYKSVHAEGYRANIESSKCTYSIDLQMKWPYNQKASKLLAAMDKRYGLEKFKEFAKDMQPFVCKRLTNYTYSVIV